VTAANINPFAQRRSTQIKTRSGIASGAPGGGGGGSSSNQDAGSALGAALLAALARQQHAQHMRGVAAGPSLADVLRPDVVAPLLADAEVRLCFAVVLCACVYAHVCLCAFVLVGFRLRLFVHNRSPHSQKHHTTPPTHTPHPHHPQKQHTTPPRHTTPPPSPAQVLERLGQHLPEEHRSVAELRQLARSAQFQQQLQAFSGALQTGQLDLSQFGLRAEVGVSSCLLMLVLGGIDVCSGRGEGAQGGGAAVVHQPRVFFSTPIQPHRTNPIHLNAQGFSVTDFLRALEELVERERQQGGAQ